MDFFQIGVKEKKGGGFEAYPDFLVARTEDLMVRAKTFYAVWDADKEGPGKGLWSTDEFDLARIVDDKLHAYAAQDKNIVAVKTMRSFSAGGQKNFRQYLANIGDNARQLDEKLTFKTTLVNKKDYVSKRLAYDLVPGDISGWDEMVGTLYKPAEREKIEWYLGSIVSGDSKKNQKFIVLYGPPGAGKGTIINIILRLFDGYVTTFDAKQLASSSNSFAASAFENNPLVAIQHDGDLSRIEDNTLLNSIVSHEIMKINQKYKPAYDARINAALIMGTNKPVKITDAQSGLIRRLIDIHPSGVKLPRSKYDALMARIEFELGAIADHCLKVYKRLGKTYYNNYQPTQMMFKTNAFFNFIEAHYDTFERQDGVTGRQAWELYKEWYKDAIGGEKGMSQYAFRSELGNYFEEYHERHTLEDGKQVRHWYTGFNADLFMTPVDEAGTKFTLVLEETISLLDQLFIDCPAQYATANGTPARKWALVKTRLADVDTSKEHYVNGFPVHHIVVDFDLRDENGNKSLALNLEAASLWPPTYAEISKSGHGVHLHYEWTGGDPALLDSQYADGIEIKVYLGSSSLRRRLTFCNNVPVASLSSGLPFKEKKRVLDTAIIGNEKTLRKQIQSNLMKEVHPGTKPSIDYIKYLLDEAYNAGWAYDVSDLKPRILIFANSSTHRAIECLNIVQSMQWKSADIEGNNERITEVSTDVDPREVYYDVEVYPNLFVVCWKFKEDPDSELDFKGRAAKVVRMINPKPHEIESLMKLKLVGFNIKGYDNHIMWAAALGFTNIELFKLSQKIIDGAVGAKFGEAFNVGYLDIWDYATNKQGLKKWQIKLGLPHKEMDATKFPWDKPVDEKYWMDVVDYCVNDVVSTEVVDEHLEGDKTARLILADLSELDPIESTANHTAKIIFGRDYKKRNHQSSFVYTKLDKEFPGYVFEAGKSNYRGELVGEGGYVYAEPGIYRDVALLDVASMHPTSIGQLNLFGEYTPRFMALVEAQLAIKNARYDEAKNLLDGKLRPYLEKIEELARKDQAAADKAAKELRYGLKIAINIVYGLTSAKFDNPFKDFRNSDNIVAKRGALFMIDLKHFLQERGFVVAHIKTDSVKIPNATPDIIQEVMAFGEKYGYIFEHEATYDRLALVNEAVYVAKKSGCDISAHSVYNPKTSCWTATGTQFIPEANPYVFKSLFGYTESIDFLDLCVSKHVQQGAIFLDFGPTEDKYSVRMTGFDGETIELQSIEAFGYITENVALQKLAEKNFKAAEKKGTKEQQEDAAHLLADAGNMYWDALGKLQHVGKTGRFMPVKPGYGGGYLYRVKDAKHYAVADTKGFLWVDSDIAMNLPGDAIDYSFFDQKVMEARATLEKFIEASEFDSVEDFLA